MDIPFEAVTLTIWLAPIPAGNVHTICVVVHDVWGHALPPTFTCLVVEPVWSKYRPLIVSVAPVVGHLFMWYSLLLSFVQSDDVMLEMYGYAVDALHHTPRDAGVRSEHVVPGKSASAHIVDE